MDAWLAMFVLTLARAGTFIHVVPLLGGTTVPAPVKIGLSLALAALFFNFDADAARVAADLATQGSISWFGFSLALAREAVLGALFGFAFSLFLAPARIAGELIAQETGLTFGNMLTAVGDGSSNPFAVLLEMLASLVFFSLDLHHLFLVTLGESITRYPIGTAFALPTWDLIGAAGAAQEGGVLLAAPLALCLFLTTVVLALMTRAAPQLNLYSVGFPLRILVSLAAMILLLPAILTGVVGFFSYFVDLLQLRG
jgi:flagellar biosynthetic protein FliR